MVGFTQSAASNIVRLIHVSFRSISNDPENLTAVVALAAMGLLTADESLIDAALSEIVSLSLDARHERDPEREIDDLLADHYLAEVTYSHSLLYSTSRSDGFLGQCEAFFVCTPARNPCRACTATATR